MNARRLIRYASWSAYANGTFAIVGFALTAAAFAFGGPFRVLGDVAFFASTLGLLPIPVALHRLGHGRLVAISLLGAIVGVVGAVLTLLVQAFVLVGRTSAEQGAGPVTAALGAIGVWMVISNYLGRLDRTLSVGLAWLGIVAGVGLVLAAAVLGVDGFRASDLGALPGADPLTAAGLVVSAVAHVASLTWAIWLGTALRGIEHTIAAAAAKA